MLGQDFARLMQQAASALPEGAINMGDVDNVARQLNVLEGLMSLGLYVDPATGKISKLKAGTAILSGQGIRIEGDETFAVFTGNQTYNEEAMTDGDVLLGSNKANQANLLWDKTSGKLLFRGGTTEQGYIDTDGAAVFGGGDIKLCSSGMEIVSGSSETNQIRWIHSSGIPLNIYAHTSGADSSVFEGFFNVGGGNHIQSNAYLQAYGVGDTSQATMTALFVHAGGENAGGASTVVFSLATLTTNATDVGLIQASINNGSSAHVVLVNSISTCVDFRVNGQGVGNIFHTDGDKDLVILTTQTKSSDSFGFGGAFAFDGSYMYVHDSTEWRRVALSTF